MNLREASKELLEHARRRDRFHIALPLIRVPCSILSASGSHGKHDDALAVAEDFVADPARNLLMVLGESGSGKSELLRQLVRQTCNGNHRLPLLMDYAEIAKLLADGGGTNAVLTRLRDLSGQAAAEFSEMMQADPSQVLLLIDAFDEINVSLHVDDPNPTPRSLYPLLNDRIKTVVAARRSLTASPHAMAQELVVAQALPESFTDGWYRILELEPCALNEVHKALDDIGGAQASVVRDYLVRGSDVQMGRVRRPLFLQMLMNLPSDVLQNNGGLSMYEIYDRYVDVTIDRDIERQQSVIPREVKRRILQNVAYDMFCAQVDRTSARLEHDDVQRRVSEETEDPSNHSWTEAPDGLDHDWCRDFILTNHLLVEQPGSVARGIREIVFIHQSMFEFFLTQHFATTFQKTGQFGLRDDAHSVRAFDSLLPYFLRSQFSVTKHQGLEDELIRLVRDESASYRDRLLGFFFLEGSPHILTLLRAGGAAYDAFLQQAASQFDSFFMKKVVWYQLALLDSGIGRALAYVSDARILEFEKELDIEVHSFAAGQNPTDFLLSRLNNPQLHRTLPITIYRLGQFGDGQAIKPLQNLMATLPQSKERYIQDPCLRALADEAITEIAKRSGEQVEP